MKNKRQRSIPSEWVAEFEAAARRPLRIRLRYAFIHTYKPVMDDAVYRSFDRMQDYREGQQFALWPPIHERTGKNACLTQ